MGNDDKGILAEKAFACLNTLVLNLLQAGEQIAED
jgi:hypothetical protein